MIKIGIKSKISNQVNRIAKYKFLFKELVKRDFKKKYKKTVLGMVWSVLSPLFTLAVLAVVFTVFFGRTINHYVIYLFCGNLIYTYFAESTTMGMTSLLDNAAIFTKVNVPKWMFLLSKNITSLINFGLSIIIMFVFCAFDGVGFTWKMIFLIYPIICLVVFNLGFGLILSASYVVFRDTKYLYNIFKMALMYCSAIFYSVEAFPDEFRLLFHLNPIYNYIDYFRTIIIDKCIPSPELHLVCIGYALFVLAVGAFIYHKKNYKFLYYI